MKRIVFSLIALGLAVLGLAGVAPGFLSQAGVQAVVQAATDRTINLDVACDCRTFKFNRDVAFDQTVRGDGFITNGKIFPAGTLRPGAQSNDPNDPVGEVSSIGTWICRGQAAFSAAEVAAGALPPTLFFTQYHMLSNGRTLVSDGFEISSTTARSAVIGGTGAFSGASGEITAVIIGTNVTGCPNIQFTFSLKRQRDD